MKKFFNFEGRSRRSEFWITCWLVGLVVLVADLGLAMRTGEFNGGWHWVTMGLNIVLVAPVSVRRMHDRNRSGWWLLIPLVLSALGQPMQPMVHADPPVAWAVGVTMVLLAPGLWLFIEMGFVPGKSGENRFGPDPKSEPEPQSRAAA